MARINDDELAGIIRSELDAADGGPSDSDLDAVRQQAIARFYGPVRSEDGELAEQGRSTLRSEDVADMVQAVVAQLAPALADQQVAAFDPLGEGDEDQAELESAMVADTIYQDNDGFLELEQSTIDTLLMRGGWLKAWVDTDESVTTERVHQVPELVLLMALMDRAENEQVEVVDQEVVAETETGEPLYSATFRRTTTHTKLRVEARRSEDMSYSSGWQRPTVEGCRFIAERAELERAELLDLGVSKAIVDDLAPYTMETTTSSSARETTATRQLGGHEYSTELVETWICHLRIDLDQAGRPGYWRILFADDQVLKKTEVPFPPYVNGWALMRPFRMDGVSLVDRLAQVEDAKTHGIRAWADNLTNRNNGRAGLVEGQVRLSDWIRRRPGGYVRIKSPDAIVPLVSEDLGPSAQLFLDYQDKVRSERGGASLDLQSAEAQVAGHTAHGTERQYSARELLASLMARNVAETLLRGLFRLVHRTMRTSGMTEVQMKRRGEWQRQDPRTWQERTRLTVGIGLTVAERQAIAAALREHMAYQAQAMQAGFRGVLVDLPQMHAAAVELAQAQRLPAPERFYIDPSSPQAQEAAQRQAQAAEARDDELQQTRAALLELTLRHERWEKSMDNNLERWQTAVQTQLAYFQSLLEAEQTEAKLVADAATTLAGRSLSSGNGASSQ